MESGPSADGQTAMQKLKETLTGEELEVFKFAENKHSMRIDENLQMSSFVSDDVEGRRVRLERGNLGLELVAN